MTRSKAFVKKPILIICIGLAALTCIIVVFVYSEKNKPDQTVELKTEIAKPLTEKAYQTEAQLAVRDYELFLKNETMISTIENRKQHLLDVIISKQFQDVHLQLVMIADSLLAFNQGNNQEEDNAEQSLTKIYSQYPWLKN